MAGNDARGRTPLSLVGQDPEALFYTRHAEERGGPVLVLGAGDGRVAWAVASRGFPVLGVDPSARLVQVAEERRAAVSEDVSQRTRFLVADVRALRLPERFPLLLAPQNALGLMDSQADLEAFFATARHHLAPGGLFAYDALNSTREHTSQEEAFGPPRPPSRPLFARHLRERRQPGASPGLHRLRSHPFSLKEFDAALAACGFTLRERYGRFDGKPFDAEDARHIGVADG